MAGPLKSIARAIFRRIIPKSAHTSLRLWLLMDWPDEVPIVVDKFGAEPVLVLAPHPDDEAIGPGGTIRRHVLAGAAVTVVVVTDGRWGGYDPDNTLVARRKAESQAAAKIIGTLDPIFLNGPDNGLDVTPEMVAPIERILRETRHAFIYLPALTDNHRDHWATNRILAAAIKSMPADYRKQVIIRGYEVWSTLIANCFVDITTVIELKKQAIDAFPSQTKIDDYTGAAVALNRYRSLRAQRGKGYAEAFMQMTVEEFEKLYAAANSRMKARASD
jgi:LmbE family N-acetylglucosaminyl deacetylase